MRISFTLIDQTGVSQLIEIAAAKGNKTRLGIKPGICGDHGGEQACLHPIRMLTE